MKFKVIFAAFLIFAFMSGMPALCDVTLKGVQHHDAVMQKPAKDLDTVHYYSDKFVKIANEENDQLFKFESGEMYSIDHKKKEYMVVDFNKMKALFDQMKPMLGDMKITVEPTGESKEILGKKCTEYLIKMESKMMTMEQRNWTSTDLDINLEKLQEFFKKQLYLTGMFENAEDFLKMKGLTIQQDMTISMMGMEIKQTFMPKEIIEDKIPAGIFDLPTDYAMKEFDPAAMQQ